MALFTTSNYPLNALIEDIDLGKIGLPELQRPFVWPNVNVRDLFDSLYRGYPAGFLLFWKTGAEGSLRGIGSKNAATAPELAIVDGQQRLTSLYAVVKGVEVVRSNFKRERIRIAFNPLSGRFDVPDAAIRKDRAFIPDISILWAPDFKPSVFRKVFLAQLRDVRDVADDEADRIEEAIDHLKNLLNYSFVALTLAASANEETVAEIFVRINGKGKRLNQADFILTLMSVFWDDGRAELEAFSLAATKPTEGRASPYNHFIKPTPDQMLRATVGLSLKRARLENVYGALRGHDAKTGLENADKRDEQFAAMREGQKAALNLTNWHHFLEALKLAGYRSEKMISSKAAIIFSYVLYLIGVRDYGLDRVVVRQVIAEFFFMAALTGRYTNSPETRFESDLGLLRDLEDGEAFQARLRELCATVLTSDYWAINLPNQLTSSAAISPSLFAYQAALIKLDADVLYGPMKISTLLDPAVSGTKAALEQHHLFPRAYLESIGVSDLKLINQIANFAPVEWPTNIKIGAKAPADYVPPLDHAMDAKQRDRVYGWHALPHLWWELPYEEFLVQRRVRMADVVRRAWETLTAAGSPAPKPATPLSVEALIADGESDGVEFKSSLRTNLHTGQVDDKMQVAVLKTVCGFLNAKGGDLLVGVSDDGQTVGIGGDGFASEDKMGLHLVNLIRDRVGDVFLPYVHLSFQDRKGDRVLVVRCEPGPKPAYLKDGALHRFFVRGGAATVELAGPSVLDYVRQRFP